MESLIAKLEHERTLSREELKAVLLSDTAYLHERAFAVTTRVFGSAVYARGLIEFTNICRNDCYYCGIRRSNSQIPRYRMSVDEILAICSDGYARGFRTFVLQGGEGECVERLCEIVTRIKADFPDCAVTLSVGELSRGCLKRLKAAGTDRYLLRQETVVERLYSAIHPPQMSLGSRLSCLRDLKELGFQTGCGFMIGVPGQTLDDIVEDLLFVKAFDPEMVGIGPFLPHAQTPFADSPAGDLRLTLNAVSITRLMKPSVLLPATTAVESLAANGRQSAILAGANVIMPNLTTAALREKYQLYDGKAFATLEEISRQMSEIGREIVMTRGDYKERLP